MTSPSPTPSKGQQTAAYQGPPVGLYSDPQDALKSLKDDFSYWTGKLTDSSFAFSLAVIGANWAVFGSVYKVLGNKWAIASVAAVILSLLISLIASWVLGELLLRQIAHAEGNPTTWEKEFNENIGKSTPWPLTPRIDWLAWSLRVARMLLPIMGGAAFLIALFTHPKTQDDQSRSGVSALATPPALSTPIEVRKAQPLTLTPTPTPSGTPTATPMPTPGPTLRPSPAPHPQRRGRTHRA